LSTYSCPHLAPCVPRISSRSTCSSCVYGVCSWGRTGALLVMQQPVSGNSAPRAAAISGKGAGVRYPNPTPRINRRPGRIRRRRANAVWCPAVSARRRADMLGPW
jgi:hypothetical protein